MALPRPRYRMPQKARRNPQHSTQRLLMSLPDKDRETLRLAARLSQVGKIFVPRELLTKKGKLTPEEQAEVMRAPEYAYGILRDMP